MPLLKFQRGMSLVELMVALGLGAFLILGVVNVMVSSKKSGQVEFSLARLQENGRIALDLITADLRMADYIGCNAGSQSPRVLATGLTWFGVRGYERQSGAWSPTLPATLTALSTVARIGSDVVSVQYGEALSSSVSAAVLSTSTAVSVDSNQDCITTNDQVIISSCDTIELFQVTNVPTCTAAPTTFQFGAVSNSPTSLVGGYTIGDDILALNERTWYVADTGRRRTDAAIPVYALYRRSRTTAEEMIEGIEHMQLSYGQRLPTGNVRYVPASDASIDMNDVISIRVALLVQSFEPVRNAADTSAYQVLDQSIDSVGTTATHNGDLTLRRVFKTTVLLRNRAQSI